MNRHAHEDRPATAGTRRSSTIGAVFARGGSKGVPGKNLRVLDGRTLIEHAIEQLGSCRGIDRIIVSTDSEEIAAVARTAGAEVPWLRPDHLATDTAREWDAWQHLIGWLDDGGTPVDRLVVAPCTAPLRRPSDIEAALAAATDGVDVVVTVTDAHRNPWFNMVRLDDDGNARLVIEPPRRLHRRQDAPAVYDVGTVAFVARAAYVRSATSLYDGTVRAVVVPRERSLDIDTEFDLAIAEMLIAHARSRPDGRPDTTHAGEDS